MGAVELVERLRSCGVSVTLDRDELVLRPGSQVPPELLAKVRQHKADLLALLAGEEPVTATWPPPESEELLARWETQGCQEIPVSPGVSISNLRTWLNPDYPQDRLAEQLAAVRGWLIEGLPALEVEVDPLLERWRQKALPD